MVKQITQIQKSSFLEIISFSLVLFSIVILISYGKGDQNKIAYASLGVNCVLALITYKYTSLTSEILINGENKNKIEYLQRRLEYFYYPLLRTIEKAEKAYVDAIKDNKYNYTKDPDYSLRSMLNVVEENIEKLYRYNYLSNKSIGDKLQSIEQYTMEIPIVDETYKKYANEDFIHKNHEKIYNDIMSLKKDLESEIKSFNEELINLTN